MLTPEQSHAPARTTPRRRPRRHPARPAASAPVNSVSTEAATEGRPARQAPARQAPASGQADRRPARQAGAPAGGRPAGPAASTTPADPAPVNVTFAELGIPASVVHALTVSGVQSPFPIQAATLPDTLAGRDVLGRGRTGSGKTLAFVLPMVTRLAAVRRAPGRPRGLILVPTRELATQVNTALAPLAAAVGLKTTTVFGGVGLGRQVSTLRNGIDILVACPGRLEELIRMGSCDLGGVEITVLDEADHMADLGFLPSVKRLLDRTPANGQRLLFSATLDNGVDVLIRRYLTDPVTHSVDPAVAPVATMVHHVFQVSTDAKADVVRELASGRDRSLLFTRTKSGARRLARALTAAGVPAVDLHGNLAQNARERNLAAFASGTVKVLVATDIAARGVHVDDIALVVHVDPPAEHKAYLHRSGRTARAGAEGVVVTIATPDQQSDVRTLARQAGISPRTVAVRPGAAHIVELTGPPAEYVAPPEPAPGANRQPSAGGRRTRRANPGEAAPQGSNGRTATTGRGKPARSGEDSRGSRGGNGGNRQGRSGGLIYTSSTDGSKPERPARSGGAAAHSERGSRRRRSGGRAA